MWHSPVDIVTKHNKEDITIELGVVKPKLFEEYLDACLNKYKDLDLNTIEHLIYGFEDL